MRIEKVKKWGILLCVIGVLFGMFYWNTNGAKTQPLPPKSIESEKVTEKNEKVKSESIVIDIKGAVKSEGVYEMAQGDRVKQAIEKAGGFSNDADVKKINLAQYVQDQMLLYVPRIGEQGGVALEQQGKKKVAINIATKEEIETIVGIGPTKAESIIRYREQKGPFKKLEDLLEVDGIGEKSLEKMKEEIIVP
ncbi:helix-hairpin-helix domain-containing protein [Ectobacillus sp. sgz5001026]|uniref:helix-hairpin-helix domain-containing protein n=1 Tax=Ectobacillus sp. sgz5001026 TaxID=3242473 RepID=UPI0036D31C91